MGATVATPADGGGSPGTGAEADGRIQADQGTHHLHRQTG